jgi:hypothetical protein
MSILPPNNAEAERQRWWLHAAEAIGLPQGSALIRVATSDGGIPADSETTLLDVTLPSSVDGRLPIPTRQLNKWRGYSFELFGRVVPNDYQRQLPWTYWPIDWGGVAVTIEIWRAQANPPGARVFAQLVCMAGPLGPERARSWRLADEVSDDGWTTEDLTSAANSLRLLLNIPTIRSGRRRLEQSANTSKLDLGRRAIGIWKNEPDLSDWDMVDRLGMVDHDDLRGDSIATRRSYDAAAKRLRRYVNRLKRSSQES